MIKQLILNLVLFAGLANIIWLFYFIYTTEHAYTIANIPLPYLTIILVYLPITLVQIPLIVFVANLFIYKQKNWYAFVPAFVALIPNAIFVIGSLFFKNP